MKDLKQELPSVNQIEQHVGWYDDHMIQFCAENDIVLQAASPLSRSLRALIVPGANDAVTNIAKKYSKSPAQVALRWLLDKGVAAIPSTTSPNYQRENLDVFDFSLTEAEVAMLGSLRLPCRGDAALGLPVAIHNTLCI